VKYRDIHNISSDLGTAVTVQSMVYGNMNVRSGSGTTIRTIIAHNTAVQNNFMSTICNAINEISTILQEWPSLVTLPLARRSSMENTLTTPKERM